MQKMSYLIILMLWVKKYVEEREVKSLTIYLLTQTIDLPKLNPDCHSNKSVIFNVTATLCTGKSLFYQLIY